MDLTAIKTDCEIIRGKIESLRTSLGIAMPRELDYALWQARLHMETASQMCDDSPALDSPPGK